MAPGPPFCCRYLFDFRSLVWGDGKSEVDGPVQRRMFSRRTIYYCAIQRLSFVGVSMTPGSTIVSLFHCNSLIPDRLRIVWVDTAPPVLHHGFSAFPNLELRACVACVFLCFVCGPRGRATFYIGICCYPDIKRIFITILCRNNIS